MYMDEKTNLKHKINTIYHINVLTSIYSKKEIFKSNNILTDIIFTLGNIPVLYK